MAVFTNLYKCAQTVAEILDSYGGLTAEVAFPPEAPDDSTERVVVTLLWVTPEPTHRNDPWDRGADGQITAPPLTMSGFFLLTSYGTSSGEPEGAYRTLGKALQTFHSRPRFELPDSALASPNGTGNLSIVMVPTAADLMEKVYAPLHIKQRPWALLHIGPIQLESLHAVAPGAPLVRPGGPTLASLDVLNKPELEKVTPTAVARGGRVRLDGRWGGAIATVRVGPVAIKAADWTQPVADGPIFVTLPDLVPPAVSKGTHEVRVQVGSQWSEPQLLRVTDAGIASVFSPPLPSQTVAADLVLAGRDLHTATHAYFWPDAALTVPAEVVEVALLPANVGVSQVIVPAAALPLPAGDHRRYRISLRASAQVYTPFVLMELTK